MEDSYQQLDQSDQQQITGNKNNAKRYYNGINKTWVRFLSNTLERLAITIFNIGYQDEVFI